MKGDRVYLQNILDCIVKIESYTQEGKEYSGHLFLGMLKQKVVSDIFLCCCYLLLMQ